MGRGRPSTGQGVSTVNREIFAGQPKLLQYKRTIRDARNLTVAWRGDTRSVMAEGEAAKSAFEERGAAGRDGRIHVE